ncbi:Fanconi anemia group A protein [Orchesella cincta]|uniref:Fanconi anemia group A protein n=1 Tax=Orchesella cincta TaxID=48709 RepID=A0A1D2MDL4_ORCCI|nr:Fanconi anemia group A protein [Orchesella cincta]
MEGNCNLWCRMESERAKIPNIVRDEYIPIFIVKCLHEKLEPGDAGGVVLKKFGAFNHTTEESMWTDDTFLEDNVDFEGMFLLSKENLNYVGRVLRFAKEAYECFHLDKKHFGRYFTDEYEHPCLELLYLMDALYNLLPVTGYLMWMKQLSQKKYFKEQFLSFVFSPTAFRFEDRQRSTRILEHFLECIILNHYCNPDNKPELKSSKLLCGDILKEMAVKLSQEESYQANPTNYSIVLAIFKDVDIPNSVRTRYFSDNLTIILNMGEKTISARKRSLTISRKMIRSTLSSVNVMEIVSTILQTADFNWEILLFLITVWIKEKEKNATTLLKDAIKSLIRDGLLKRNENDVTTGFILARHCSLVASTFFSRYEKWFTNMFESGMYSPANDAETFTFLTEMLTSWLPNEPSCFLHVHATFWPFVPKGCRETWNDYISLAKVRISEYKEVEEAMQFEPNLNDPIQYEVEMAIKAFEKNGKIPQSILKLWIVRKKYYLESLLPVLLRKPSGHSGVPLSDSKRRFIELLRREGKIPDAMYTEYKAAIRSS